MLCQFRLYSKMNQPYIYIYPLPYGLPSHSGHHSALSRVPCAIQQVLISYLFYTQYQQCICVNPNLPIPPTTPLSPMVSIHLFSTSVSLFLLCKQDHLYHFSSFHIYVLIYDIFFSLSDLLHSVLQFLGLSTSFQMTQFRSFLWLSNIPLYICTTSSLFIPLLMDIQVASMSWLL